MKFHSAVVVALLAETSTTVCAFHVQTTAPAHRTTKTARHISSSLPEYSNRNANVQKLSQSIANALEQQQQADLVEDAAIDQQQQQRRRSHLIRSPPGSYRVTLPLDRPLGIRLLQVDYNARVSNLELHLDTGSIQRVRDSSSGEALLSQILQQQQQQLLLLQDDDDETNNSSRTIAAATGTSSSVVLQFDPNFRGVIVSHVSESSLAWEQGVRPGQVLSAVSATLGDSLWPKSTLEGVKSAVSSRRMVAGTVSFEFLTQAAAVNNNTYELTLTRPLGFQIQQVAGQVVVTGISEDASNLVKYAVQVGDVVAAVDASLGDQLWPVSTVEGVISACTSRLPGQPVTMRFERPLEKMPTATNDPSRTFSSATAAAAAVTEPPLPPVVAAPPQDRVKQAPDKNELIQRCRDVLKRYAIDDNAQKVRSRLDVLPAMVAEKVVDALASAEVAVDSVTLSMIMNAYLSSGQSEDALRIFEATTGFRADGSALAVGEISMRCKDGKCILPNESALNLYTVTHLLRAHALKGDLPSVIRVLAALEGRSGVEVDGLESAPWPWTGTYGSIQPDTTCYNVAMSAAEKVGGTEGLELALSLFDSMSDSKVNDRRPVKDVVTYNTVISALTNAGRFGEAFSLFDRMRRSGLRPDKFTYTTLIRACVHEGDVQELLYDMKENGVDADVVTYNTIIRSMCEKRQWTQATKLVTEMESRGVSPDSKTYGLLMNGMLKADKPGACLTLFESAYSTSRTTALTESVELYTMAITAASVLGDHERALELVSRMTASGVKPNLKTLTAVMGACLAANEPQLAVDIYKQIPAPDGYAMAQGIRAFCSAGLLDEAASMLESQRRGSRMMSGKLMMSSYNALIRAALVSANYDIAKSAMTDLLKKGYIPNSLIFLTMNDAFGLNKLPEKNLSSMNSSTGNVNMEEAFQYLLFVVDSLRARNLPIDGVLYAATLTAGYRAGGVSRQIAALLAQAKQPCQTVSGKEILSAAASNSGQEQNYAFEKWESLLLASSSSPDVQQLPNDAQLPSLPVRVSTRDVRRVLRAEQWMTSSRKSRISNNNGKNSKKQQKTTTVLTASSTS